MSMKNRSASRAERRKQERDEKKGKKISTPHKPMPMAAGGAVSADVPTYLRESATTIPHVVFTKEQLEEYAKWKTEWLKSQGKTEEEQDREIENLGRWLAGGS